MLLLPRALLLLLTWLLAAARAHRGATTRPSCDNDFGSSTTALNLADASISWSFRHYVDCTHRAVWITFENPYPGFEFYVGVGVPTLDRLEHVRANALIIGPGLPPLSNAVWEQLPVEIQNDPVWQTGSNMGAYYHRSPADQSTCDHLGTVMKRASTVRNGRCDFYEPFGRKHSWRILDADQNQLLGSGVYHVAVWLQDDESAKFTIAMGTWVEDFRSRLQIETPTCARNLQDFYETSSSSASDCFPVVSCPDHQGPVGCDPDWVMPDQTMQEEPLMQAPSDNIPPSTRCELGETCVDAKDCQVAGVSYQTPVMGACGGERCPAAVTAWEQVNADMHRGMMDLEYSGHAPTDFVRSMIPHHTGAVHMCRVLLEDLTCTDVDDIDNLEGLVHFCNHVQREQEMEVTGMRQWLEQQGLNELAPCSETPKIAEGMEMADTMPTSCGVTDTPASTRFIHLNHKMHKYMAIEYSCNHVVDFVRMMLPHHAGAIEMCQVLVEESTSSSNTPDDYLIQLCQNITLTQRAEMAFMHEWLASRDLAATAPCNNKPDDCPAEPAVANPCEDLLSMSSFCHNLGADGYCRCDEALLAKKSVDGTSVLAGGCDAPSYIDGVGTFDPSQMCRRTCQRCGAESSGVPLWPLGCSSSSNSTAATGNDHDTMGHGGNGGGGSQMGGDHHDGVMSMIMGDETQAALMSEPDEEVISSGGAFPLELGFWSALVFSVSYSVAYFFCPF